MCVLLSVCVQQDSLVEGKFILTKFWLQEKFEEVANYDKSLSDKLQIIFEIQVNLPTNEFPHCILLIA